MLTSDYVLETGFASIDYSIWDFSSSAFSAFFCFNNNSMRSFYDANLLAFDIFFTSEVNRFFTMCSVRVDFMDFEMSDHFFPRDLTNLSSSISYSVFHYE